MYDQTGKLWFKIIAFIVLEAFLFTLVDVSWAANYREQRGSQQMLLDSQKNKNEQNNTNAEALSNQLVLTQPAMPFMGFGQVTQQGQMESVSLIDTTITGLSIAGNDLTDIFKTLKDSGCSVSEAGFGAMRQGFDKKEIYHALMSAGYDKEEVKTLLGSLLKIEAETKKELEESAQTKTGPPAEQTEQDKNSLKQKQAIFEIPSVTDLPIEKDAAKLIEKTVTEGAVLRQTVEFVRLMINEGKRGKDLIMILKKAGLSNERITTALAQLGFNLKDIINILKDANISCADIVQSIYNSQINYSDKDIYTALLKAGFSDEEIIAALKQVGMNAQDILKLTTDLGRNMTEVANAMVSAGFNVGDIARAYILKAMQWTWDNSVHVINCAVKAFDAFLTNVGKNFSSQQDLAYELIIDDILATGEVKIQNQDVMTSMSAIKNVAQNHGIDLEGYNVKLQSLMELEGISLVHLDGDHWVTLVGIEGDQVTIIDNGQTKTISLSEFEVRWDGNILAMNQEELNHNKLLELQMREIRGGRGGIFGAIGKVFKAVVDVVKKVVDAVVEVVKKVWDVIKIVVIVVVAAVLTYVTAGALAPVFIAMYAAMAGVAVAAVGAVAVAACWMAATFVASLAVSIAMSMAQGKSFGESFKGGLITAAIAAATYGMGAALGGLGAAAGGGVGAAAGQVAGKITMDVIIDVAVTALKQAVVSYAVTKVLDSAGIDNPYLRAAIVGAAGAWAGSSTFGLSTNGATATSAATSRWDMSGLMSTNIAKQMLTGAATQISVEAVKQEGYKQNWDPLVTDCLSLAAGTLTNVLTSSALGMYKGKVESAKDFTPVTGQPPVKNNFTNLVVANFNASMGGLIGSLATKVVDRICLQNGIDPILSAGLSSITTSLFTSLTNYSLGQTKDFGMTDIYSALKDGVGAVGSAGYKDYLIRELGYTQADATSYAYALSEVTNLFTQNREKGTSITDAQSINDALTSLASRGVESLGLNNGYKGSSYEQTKYLDTFDSEIDTIEYMMYASDPKITLGEDGVYRNPDGSKNTYMNRNAARTEYNEYWKKEKPEVFDRGTAPAATGNVGFGTAWSSTMNTRMLTFQNTQTTANFSSTLTNLQLTYKITQINGLNAGVTAQIGPNQTIQFLFNASMSEDAKRTFLQTYAPNSTQLKGATDNGIQIDGVHFASADDFFRGNATAYQRTDTESNSSDWVRNQRVYTSDTTFIEHAVKASTIENLMTNQNLSLVSFTTTNFINMLATSFTLNGNVAYNQTTGMFVLQNATFTALNGLDTVDFSMQLSNKDTVYASVKSGQGFNNTVLRSGSGENADVYKTQMGGVAEELRIEDITSKSNKVSSLEVALTVSASGNLNLEDSSLSTANGILSTENGLAASVITNLPSGCNTDKTRLELANTDSGLQVYAIENIAAGKTIKYAGEDAKITSKSQLVYNREGAAISIRGEEPGKNSKGIPIIEGVSIQTKNGDIILANKNEISFANQKSSFLSSIGSYFGLGSGSDFTIIKGEALAITDYKIIDIVAQQQSGAGSGAGETNPGLNKIILVGDANSNQYIQEGSLFTIENNNWVVKENDVVHNNSGKAITVSGKLFESGEIAAVHKGNVFKAEVADIQGRKEIEYKLDLGGLDVNCQNTFKTLDTTVSLPINAINVNNIYLTSSGALTFSQDMQLQSYDTKGINLVAAQTTFSLTSDSNTSLKLEFSQIGLSGNLVNPNAQGLKVGSNQLRGDTQISSNDPSETIAKDNVIKINLTKDSSYYKGGEVTLTSNGLVYKPSDRLEITGLSAGAEKFNANSELYTGSFVSVGNLKLITDGSYKLTQNSVMSTNANSQILITLTTADGKAHVDTVMNLQKISVPDGTKSVDYYTPNFQDFSVGTAGMSFDTQGIKFTIKDNGTNKFEARSKAFDSKADSSLKSQEQVSHLKFEGKTELTINALGNFVTADNMNFGQASTLKAGAEVKVLQDKSVEILSGQVNLAKQDALQGTRSVATIQPESKQEPDKTKKDNNAVVEYKQEAKIDLLGAGKYNLYGDLSFNQTKGVYLADNTKVNIANLAKEGKDFVTIGNASAVKGTFGVNQGQITALSAGSQILEHITKTGEYVTLEHKGVGQGWKVNASTAAIKSKESWAGTIQGKAVNFSLAIKNKEAIIQINDGAGVELTNQILAGYGDQRLENVTVIATQKLAPGQFVYTTTDERAIGFKQLQGASAGGSAIQMLGKTVVSISDSFDNGQRIRTYGAQTNGAFSLTFTADEGLNGINVAEQLNGSSLEIKGSARVNGETFLKGTINYSWNGQQIVSSYTKGTTILIANTAYGQVSREYLGRQAWKLNASQSAVDNKASWAGTYRDQAVNYNLASENGETIIQINKGAGLQLENQTIITNTNQKLTNVDVTVTQMLANGQFVYTTTDKDAIGLQQKIGGSAGGAAMQMEGKTIASISDNKNIRTYGAQTNGNFELTFTADQNMNGVNVVEQLNGSSLEIKGSARVNGETFLKGTINYSWNGQQIVSSYTKGTTILIANTAYGQVSREYLGGQDWKLNASQAAVDNNASWNGKFKNQAVSYNLATKNGETIIQINKGAGLQLENQTIITNTNQKLTNVDVTVTQMLANGQFVYTTTDKDAIGLQQKIGGSAGGAAMQMEGKTIASISDNKNIRTYGAQTNGNFELTFTADQNMNGVNVVEQLDGSYLQVKNAEIGGQYIKDGGISFSWNADKGQIVSQLDNNTLLNKGGVKGVGGVDVLYTIAGKTENYRFTNVSENDKVKFDNRDCTVLKSESTGELYLQVADNSKYFGKKENFTVGDTKVVSAEIQINQIFANGTASFTANNIKLEGNQTIAQLKGTPSDGKSIEIQGATIAHVTESKDGKSLIFSALTQNEGKHKAGDFQLTFVTDIGLTKAGNITYTTDGSYLQVTNATIAGQFIKEGGVSFTWDTTKKEIVSQLDSNSITTQTQKELNGVAITGTFKDKNSNAEYILTKDKKLHEVSSRNGDAIKTVEIKGDKTIKLSLFGDLATDKGALKDNLTLKVQNGELVSAVTKWQLAGVDITLNNFNQSSFTLESNGKKYTFDIARVNAVDHTYEFTPYSRDTYDVSKTEDKQFLQTQKFTDVTGKTVTIDTQQNQKVSFVYDISGNLAKLEGGSIKVDGMMAEQIIVDEFGGMAVDSSFYAKGVVLTLNDSKGGKTDIIMLNGSNSVSMAKDTGVLTIEKAQAITLDKLDTGLKANSTNKADLLHIVNSSGGVGSGSAPSKNVINVDVSEAGTIIVQEYQTINLSITGKGTQFVLGENDYLNNLSQTQSITIVDVNNKQFEITAGMQAHITSGSVERHSNGEIVDKNSYIGRAWNSLGDAKTWSLTEEVNGSWRITNKIAGATQATFGGLGLGVAHIADVFIPGQIDKTSYLEVIGGGADKMFNAGVSRSISEISGFEMLGATLVLPAVIAATAAVIATGGAMVSAIGAFATSVGALGFSGAVGAAVTSGVVLAGLKTMGISMAVSSIFLAGFKSADIVMEQGWSALATREAWTDIGKSFGEGLKTGFYFGLLSIGGATTGLLKNLGESSTRLFAAGGLLKNLGQATETLFSASSIKSFSSLAANVARTSNIVFGTTSLSTIATNLGGALGARTGMQMLTSGFNVGKFGAGFHVLGKGLNTAVNLLGYSDSDAFLPSAIRGMGQGSVEQAIITGFAFGMLMGTPILTGAMKLVEGLSLRTSGMVSNFIGRISRTVFGASRLEGASNSVTTNLGKGIVTGTKVGSAFALILGIGQAITIAKNNPDNFWSTETAISIVQNMGLGFALGFAYSAIVGSGGVIAKFVKEWGGRTAQEITIEQTASSVLQGAGVPQPLAEVLVEFLPGGGSGNISILTSQNIGGIISSNSGNSQLRRDFGQAQFDNLAQVIPNFNSNVDSLKSRFFAKDSNVSFKGETLEGITEMIVSVPGSQGAAMGRHHVSVAVASELGVTVGAYIKAMESQNSEFNFNAAFDRHGMELGTMVITEGVGLGQLSRARGLDENYMSDRMKVSDVREVLGSEKSQQYGLNNMQILQLDAASPILSDVSTLITPANLNKIRVGLNQISLRQYGQINNIDIKDYAKQRNFQLAPAIVGIQMNAITYFATTGVSVTDATDMYNLNSNQAIGLIKDNLAKNEPALLDKIIALETSRADSSWESLDKVANAVGVTVEDLLFKANVTVENLVALSGFTSEQHYEFERKFNVRISNTDYVLRAVDLTSDNINTKLQAMLSGGKPINLKVLDSSNNMVLELGDATRIVVRRLDDQGLVKLDVTEGAKTTTYNIKHDAKTNQFNVVDAVVNVDGKSFNVVQEAQEVLDENGNVKVENGKQLTITVFRVKAANNNPETVEQAEKINDIISKLEDSKSTSSNKWSLMERNGVNQLSKAIQLAFDKNTLWEIPAGTGKTYGIFYLASALANQVSGKKVIFVLHNAPLYNDIVGKYSGEGENADLKPFYDMLGIEAMEFKTETLRSLEQSGQSANVVQDKIKDAGVVFMQADTWGFFALGTQQSSKIDQRHEAVGQAFTAMFKNSKIVHDEVDTAFSKNKFQQGLNPRDLTQDETKSAVFVDTSIRTMEVAKDTFDENGNKKIERFVIGKGTVAKQPDGTYKPVVVQTDGSIKVDTRMLSSQRLESERSLMMFKLENTSDSNEIITLTYDQLKSRPDKHNFEIIGAEFNKYAKQAIVQSLADNAGFINDAGESILEVDARGDIVAKQGVTLTASQNKFLNNIKASLAGRAKVLRMYEGQNSGYDQEGSGQGRDDKFLVKPFANMSLASSLQVGDPFIAAHSEIVFKDLLSSGIVSKATPEEIEQQAWNPLLHKVGVSGRAKVTAMNRAITMAINLGADFSGFSGTVSPITQLALSFYGVESSLHNGGNIVSRMFNQTVKVQQNNSFENAWGSIVLGKGQVYAVLNGQGGVDEDSIKASVIDKAIAAGYTVIVKDQDVKWEIYRSGQEKPTVVETGKIEEYLEKNRTEGEGVLFYYNQSACRGTDTKLSSQEAEMINSVAVGGEVKVHAYFNAETTKTVAEQLLKRDRGLRLAVIETKNSNGDVTGFEINTKEGEYQYMYRNLETGGLVTVKQAEYEALNAGKKRDEMFTEAINDLTINFIGSPVNNTPTLNHIESGLVLHQNVSKDQAKTIVSSLSTVNIDMLRSDLIKAIKDNKLNVKNDDVDIIIEKAQLQTLFVANDVREQKKMLLNGLMEIYDSVVTSHLEQLRDSKIDLKEAKFIEELIIDFNNQSGIDTNITMQDSAQSGTEALQKKIDGIVEFFKERIENGSLINNLSAENFQQIQEMAYNTQLLTFKSDPANPNPNPIALSKTLSEAIISTNHYIQESQMPEIAPLSGQSLVNTRAQDWTQAAQSIEKQTSDSVVTMIKEELEEKGHLSNGRLTQGGVLFINYLKQLTSSAKDVQTAIEKISANVGSEKGKVVDLPDDLIQKWAQVLFTLIGADIISLNVTSGASVAKLTNTVKALQVFEGVINLNDISSEDYKSVLANTDSTAIGQFVLSKLDKNENEALYDSINSVLGKHNSINIKVEKLQRSVRYLQARDNRLYSDYIGTAKQKSAEFKDEGKVSFVTRAYNNLVAKATQSTKQIIIGTQRFFNSRELNKANINLGKEEINQQNNKVNIQELSNIAQQLGDTKLENVGTLNVLFNSGMDTSYMAKVNSIVAVFADMGLSRSIDTFNINTLANFNTINKETRESIIKELVGENNIVAFNQGMKDLVSAAQSNNPADFVSSIDKVKVNFINGTENSHLKIINWMTGADFNQADYHLAQARSNLDMSEAGAISDYKKVLDEKSDATSMQRAQANYSLGMIYFAKGQDDPASYDQAIIYMENVANYSPDDNLLIGIIADANVKLGDINIVKYQQKATSQDETAEESLVSAKASYEKALELDANSASAYFGLGRINLQQGDNFTAQDNFNACISKAKGQDNYGNMVEFAKTLLNQAVDSINVPDIVKVIDENIGLARKNVEAKEYGKAVDNFKKALSLANQMEQKGFTSQELNAFIAGNNKNLANALKMKAKQTDDPMQQKVIFEAIVDCYKAAIAKDDKDAELYYDLGSVYKVLGNIIKAKDAFQTADKLAGKNLDIKEAVNLELEEIRVQETFEQKSDKMIMALDLAITDLNKGELEKARQGFNSIIEDAKSDSLLSGIIVGRLVTIGENLIAAKQFDKSILVFSMVDQAANNIAQDRLLVQDKIALKENIDSRQQTAKFGLVMQTVSNGITSFDQGGELLESGNKAEAKAFYAKAAKEFQASIDNAGNVADNSGLQVVVAAAHFNKALSLLQSDDPEQSAKAFEEFKQVMAENKLEGKSAQLADRLGKSNDITALLKVDQIMENINQNDSRKGDQMGKAFAIDVNGRSFQIPVIGEKKENNLGEINLEMSSMWEKDGSKITIPIVEELKGKELDNRIKDIKSAANNLPDAQKTIVDAIIGFAEAKGINLLAPNAANVMGFANGKGEIFISKKLAEHQNSLVSAMAVFHEAGEAYFNENDELLPVGVSSHTYLRGCGKDVRNAMPEAIKNLIAQNKDITPTELVKELNSILSGDKQVTSSEMALIDDNFSKGKSIQDWDKGLGDVVSKQGMVQLTDAFRGLKDENALSSVDVRSDKLPNPELDKELLKTIDINPSIKSMETLMMLGDLLHGKLAAEEKNVNTMMNTVQQFQKAADML